MWLELKEQRNFSQPTLHKNQLRGEEFFWDSAQLELW